MGERISRTGIIAMTFSDFLRCFGILSLINILLTLFKQSALEILVRSYRQKEENRGALRRYSLHLL